ncbi:hypothetical protein IVA88_28205 [Bradyrhizobium sp. 149]|nr:hypothetical protein [Bradyrhizobium sp. 149]
MLLGCAQSTGDFAASTRMNLLADERNCFVVYPEQPRGEATTAQRDRHALWSWEPPA